MFCMGDFLFFFGGEVILQKRGHFTARRYILARYLLSSCVCLSVRPSVRHKPVLYRNDSMNRTGFWHGVFLPPIPHCVIRKFGYLQKLCHFLLKLCPKLQTADFFVYPRHARPRRIMTIFIFHHELWHNIIVNSKQQNKVRKTNETLPM